MKQQKANRALRKYLAGIYTTGAALWVLSLFADDNGFSLSWVLLTVASLFVATVNIRPPKSTSTVISMGDVFIVLALVNFGPGPAVVTYGLQSVGAGMGDSIRRSGLRSIRNIPSHKILFNLAQCGISVWGMYLAYETAYTLNLSDSASHLVGLAAIALIWFVINTSTIGMAVSLSSDQSFWTAWTNAIGLKFLNSFGSTAAAGLILLFYEGNTVVFLLALPIAAVFYQLYIFYIDKYEHARAHIAELNKLYLQTVEALATAVDAKDRYTHGHIRRVQAYAVELAKRMGIEEAKEIMAIRSGALLHDIGKIAIPEYILNKPTVLTESEFEKMKAHPSIGATMLQGIEFPFPVQPLVKSHHERWDGRGYPDGLRGEEIPLSARILSLVDCYDALTTNRPYRAPMTREEVMQFFRRESGHAYDPSVVEAFVANMQALEEEGAKVEVPTMDIWGSETAAARQTGNIRPLEKVEPTLTYSKAMDVSPDAQLELYSIFEFVRSARSLQVRDILTLIGLKLERLIPFDAAVFYLVDLDREVVTPSHVVGNRASAIHTSIALPLDQKLSGWVAANNEALLNLPPFPDFHHWSEPQPHFEISAIAPMNHHGTIVGSLALYRQDKKKFTDQEFRHLEITAGQTAVALHRSVNQEDSHGALFDELTGLPNGYQMYLMFDQVAMDAQRYEYPLAVFAFQVEGLPEIKRRYGHLSANEVLRFLTKHLKSQVRETDILVRYAEDQFLTLHPKMGRDKAEALKSRIQDELDRQRIPVRHSVKLSPRVSIGLAQFPQEGTKLEDLLSIAEWRLSDDQKLRAVARQTLRFPS